EARFTHTWLCGWSQSTHGGTSWFRRWSSLYSPKMQRVPEVLQLSVIVERARPSSLEPQLSHEFNLVSGHLTAERAILKEFSEPRFVLWRQPGFSFNELESLRVPW